MQKSRGGNFLRNNGRAHFVNFSLIFTSCQNLSFWPDFISIKPEQQAQMPQYIQQSYTPSRKKDNNHKFVLFIMAPNSACVRHNAKQHSYYNLSLPIRRFASYRKLFRIKHAHSKQYKFWTSPCVSHNSGTSYRRKSNDTCHCFN